MVFGTAEHQFLSDDYFTQRPNIALLNSDENFFAVTPSVWSSMGFLKLGLLPSRVKVVPHGVDMSIYNGDRAQRETIRQFLGLRGFVFLHCGAMTRNKGVDLLLILKGTDGLYGSKDLVSSYISQLDYYGQRKVAERIVYIGNVLSMPAMSDLYRAADLYVSPYRAEGFNLPVLEAAACGTPIVCTSGGPTDEFVTDAFCRKVRSILKEGSIGNWLEPDLEHLVFLMEQAMQADHFRAAALVQGPLFVSREHSWDRVAEKLIGL
jgi:glycosyltransferase involved in cell wall biosynthesis